jgi:hypothetical protein
VHLGSSHDRHIDVNDDRKLKITKIVQSQWHNVRIIFHANSFVSKMFKETHTHTYEHYDTVTCTLFTVKIKLKSLCLTKYIAMKTYPVLN